MDKQLTFHEGTFAGQKIRVTNDGYASIYDIMRVAGVGSDPSNVWKEVQPRLQDFRVTSEDGKPAVKYFKFSGRGKLQVERYYTKIGM
jgi:hypothetical protein